MKKIILTTLFITNNYTSIILLVQGFTLQQRTLNYSGSMKTFIIITPFL